MRVAIVADDLTGAADSAAVFAGDAAVVLGLRPSVAESCDAAVVSVDADTRRLDTEVAAERMHRYVAEIVSASEAIVLRKIDSTLRGHVGPETAAALRALALRPGADRPLAVVAPAFPATGRTMRGGCLQVAGLGGAVRTAGEPAVLLSRAGLRVDALALEALRGGAADTVLERAAMQGAEAVVCDAQTDDDLDRVVAAARRLLRPVLYVGSAGLAGALARDLGMAGSGCPSPPRAPMLALAGSRSSVTHAQVRRLRCEGGVRCATVSPAQLDGGSACAAHEPSWSAHLRAGGDLVLRIARGDADGPDAIALAEHLANLAAPLMPAAGVLMVTGGDTARSAMACLGVSAFTVRGSIEPGVVVLMPHGHTSRPTFVTKAGGFGDQDTLVRVQRWLRDTSIPPQQGCPLPRPTTR